MRYQADGVPLVIIAGKEYGTGSSRDWAAKGAMLLGVKAVMAVSFERIHRSNLVGMGVLPLQFKPGDSAQTLGLDGTEVYSIEDLAGLKPHSEVSVRARKVDGKEIAFHMLARIDSAVELKYWQGGGILQTVLREMVRD
jgi:aconitate hydratase